MVSDRPRTERLPAPSRPRALLRAVVITSPLWILLLLFWIGTQGQLVLLQRQAEGNSYLRSLSPLVQAIQFQRALTLPSSGPVTELDRARRHLREAILRQRLDEWKATDDRLGPRLGTSSLRQVLDRDADALISVQSDPVSGSEQLERQAIWIRHLMQFTDHVNDTASLQLQPNRPAALATSLATQVHRLVEALTRTPVEAERFHQPVDSPAFNAIALGELLRTVHDAELRFRQMLTLEEGRHPDFTSVVPADLRSWLGSVHQISEALEPAIERGAISPTERSSFQERSMLAGAQGTALASQLREKADQAIQRQMTGVERLRIWCTVLSALGAAFLLRLDHRARKPKEKMVISLPGAGGSTAARPTETEEPLREAA